MPRLRKKGEPKPGPVILGHCRGIEVHRLDGLPFMHAQIAELTIGEGDEKQKIGDATLSLNGSALYIFIEGKEAYAVPLFPLLNQAVAMILKKGEDRDDSRVDTLI